MLLEENGVVEVVVVGGWFDPDYTVPHGVNDKEDTYERHGCGSTAFPDPRHAIYPSAICSKT